jgi:hypothetical protein
MSRPLALIEKPNIGVSVFPYQNLDFFFIFSAFWNLLPTRCDIIPDSPRIYLTTTLVAECYHFRFHGNEPQLAYGQRPKLPAYAGM